MQLGRRKRTVQIALIEDTRSINELLLDGAVEDHNTSLISLNPNISCLLDLKEIPHRTLIDYGGREERVREGMERYHALERLTSTLDAGLSRIHGIPSLTPAQYVTYNLKILLDMVHCSVDILHRIFAQDAPEEVRIYSSYSGEMRGSGYGFAEKESLYSPILQLDGWPVPVKTIHPHPGGLQSSTWEVEGSGRPRSAALLKNHDLLFNTGITLKRDGILAAARIILSSFLSRCDMPALIYGSGYNWDDSLTELIRAGCYPIYRITDEHIPRERDILRTFEKEVIDLLPRSLETGFFTRVSGIDVGSFLSDKIAEIVGWSTAESIAAYTLSREMIHRKGIRCLLLSAHDSPGGHAVVQAARDSRIPVISWQHGGAGFCYHPMMPYLEFLHSDIHLVFGEGVAAEYRRTVEQLGLKASPAFIPTGSSSLDRVRSTRTLKKMQPDLSPIVYITTSFLRKKFYFISQGFDPVTWDEHLWSVQKGVVELAQAHRDRTFIIKLHPSHTDREPLQSLISDRGVGNIRIVVQEYSIPDLVRKSAAVLLDHVSTGILQAALFPLPLFVYTGLGGVENPAWQVLSRRAYLFNTIDEFAQGVERFLGRPSGDPDYSLRDDEFIRSYGIHADDGRGAERAAEVVRETMRTWPTPTPLFD